jgi:CheY-like chemotaxis protein
MAGIGTKILIVEDEGIIANHIALMLKEVGYEVVGITASSEETFAILKEQAPDLILMDIHLQGPMDGIETAEKVLQDLVIPIIYLCAHTDRQTVDRARATGRFQVLTKPIDWTKLFEAIDEAIAKHRAGPKCVENRA